MPQEESIEDWGKVMIESRLSMIIEVLRNYCAWDVLIMNCMMLDYVKNKDKLEINKNKCNK